MIKYKQWGKLNFPEIWKSSISDVKQAPALKLQIIFHKKGKYQTLLKSFSAIHN